MALIVLRAFVILEIQVNNSEKNVYPFIISILKLTFLKLFKLAITLNNFFACACKGKDLTLSTCFKHCYSKMVQNFDNF